MHNGNNKKLSLLQEKLLEMFKWFHAFCEDNGLQYYALGGTMLGAVRHKGFIPWDDDIDVGMPRKDYERFLELCDGKRIGRYVTESVHTPNKDYFYGYSKVYDTSTTLIEKARVNLTRGVFIDVFPLDGIADAESEIKKNYYPIYLRYQLLVARTCAINERRSWYKNFSIYVARSLPNWLVDNKKLLLKIDKMCSKFPFESSVYVGNLLGNWGIKEIIKREDLGKVALYDFEDMKIWGSENYDIYLTSLYGNWRKLPPKEKQVTHHDYEYLNLNKSYIE